VPKKIAIVPIRRNSRGLKGKNTRQLNGIPLYLHAVKQGLRTVGQVVLSTDISEIKQDDLPKGCILCRRPDVLAQDDTPLEPVISHLIEAHSLQDQTLVLLQATSPLRTDEDVSTAMALFEQEKHDLVMTVVARNNNVLKYGTLESQNFIAMREPAYCFQNRQNLPPVYGPNGAVYVFSAQQFIAERGFPSSQIGVTEMSKERSADIDTYEDFRRAEEYMEKLGH